MSRALAVVVCAGFFACSSTGGDPPSAVAAHRGDPGAAAGASADPGGAGSGGPASTTPSTLPRGPLPPAVASCATSLEAELALLKVPGLSAGIIKNDKLVCTAVAGMANIEEKRPVTPDTVFTWASVSKTVTAVTLMTLFDEGKFELDDGINGYLPFQVHVPACPDAPITFRQLLTHNSSIIENETKGVYADSYAPGDSRVALGDFLQNYLVPGGRYYSSSGSFANGCPGTINSYSNVGAGMLGYLAESITKTSFDDLAMDRVFVPLGMNETSFRLKPFDLDHVAMPYKGGSAATFKPVGYLGFPTYPDGLLRTSVPQLARFLTMFMRFGELDGKRILSAATAKEMRRIQFPDLDDTQGLIWYFDSFGSRTKVLGHDGDDPGITSKMYFDPKDNAGVILVGNGEWKESAAVSLMEKLFLESTKY